MKRERRRLVWVFMACFKAMTMTHHERPSCVVQGAEHRGWWLAIFSARLMRSAGGVRADSVWPAGVVFGGYSMQPSSNQWSAAEDPGYAQTFQHQLQKIWGTAQCPVLWSCFVPKVSPVLLALGEKLKIGHAVVVLM